MSRTRSSRSSRGAAAFVLGLLAVVTGFVFAGTGLEIAPQVEARARAEGVAAFRIALGAELPPARASAEEAERQPLLAGEEQVRMARSATRVRIPSLGIDVQVRSVGYVFRQGTLQYDVPRVEAGQYGSVSPGAEGNLVLGGHVASRSGPAVFRALPNVRVGETVEVFRGDTVFRYRITEVRLVEPGETDVMSPTQDATLTLITCSPDQNYAKRFVVVGKLL